MSSVDNRVVEMQFNNQQFERNASQTMNTLSSLKKSLNMDSSAKSINNLQQTANRFSMEGMANSVQTIADRFSTLGIVGVTAIQNIANTAMWAGASIVKSLTLDPVINGFREYETQINSVQTILANTQSKGTQIGDVTSALDELNEYADKTIYNFTEMTRNIGTFTAAGVDLDKSVTAIKGIANLGAISGSNSLQVSTAMYQLSQALAAGRVSLMDWNSVVNAGMGGEVFQNALKRTAENMGTDVDALIKKYGSFRESLTQGEWLTADVLTETLTQLSGAYSKEELMAQGYTEQQANDILQLADTAVSAATEIKTVSGIIDNVRETLGSGWAQTWEIIFGDFEEAKALFTPIANSISGFIQTISDARNEMLQTWKDLGGRTEAVEALKNVFEGLVSVVKPIGDAFSEIFPPMTGERLYELTVQFKNFTENLKLSDEAAEKVKTAFKGLFSVIDLGIKAVVAVVGGIIDIASNLTPFATGILEIVSAIGSYLTGVNEAAEATDFFGTVIGGITGFVDILADAFWGFIDGILPALSNFASFMADIFSNVGEAISNFLTQFNFEQFISMLNGALLSGVLVSIYRFVKSLTDSFDEFGGFAESFSEILDGVKDSLEAWQTSLKADALLKIAAAVGVLALSLAVLSTIDPEALGASLAAISILFGELMGSMLVFDKFTETMSVGGPLKAATFFIGLSVSLLILAGALKVMASIDIEDMGAALVGLVVTLASLAAFMKVANLGSLGISTGLGIMGMATGLLILSLALKQLGSMDMNTMIQGLSAVAIFLAEITLFSKLAASGGQMIAAAASLMVISSALLVLSGALRVMGGMSWEEVGKSLITLAGSLTILAVAMKFMQTALPGAAALLVISAALSVLAPVLMLLGNMSLAQIGTSLLALAGSFAVLGVAAALLQPVIPAMLGLAAAITLLGVGIAGIGTGIFMLGAGLTMIATAGSAAAVSLVAVFTAIISLIPMVFQQVGNGLIIMLQTIAASGTAIMTAVSTIIISILTAIQAVIPVLMTTIGMILTSVINLIITYVPQFGVVALVLINTFLMVIQGTIPNIVATGIAVIMAVLTGIRDNIYQMTTTAMEAIQLFIDGVAAELPGLVDSGIKAMISFINSCADGLRNNQEAFRAALRNLFSAVGEVVAGMASDFMNAGVDIVNGLISGVSSMGSAMWNAVSGLAGDALNGFKSALGIASPSKEFRKLGVFMVEGLNLGIKDESKTAEDEASKFGKRVADSMKESLNYVDSLIQNGSEYTPTIKPVVDMGDINNIRGLTASINPSGFSSNVGALVETINVSQSKANQNKIPLTTDGKLLVYIANTDDLANKVYVDGAIVNDDDQMRSVTKDFLVELSRKADL